MRKLLGLSRFVVMMSWVLFMWGCCMTLWPFLRGDEVRCRRWKRWWFQRWGRGACRIMNLRIEIEGDIPAHPGYIVCNHLGYMDIFVLTAAVSPVFVAMEDISRWPLLGWISKTMFTIFIDRTSKTRAGEVLPAMQHAIAMGEQVLLFPEGGVSRGIAVDPFKSPLIEPAAKEGKPVIHLSLHYETAPGAPPASTLAGWWRPEPVLGHYLRFLSYGGTTCRVHVGVLEPGDRDRKELARVLHERVSEHFAGQP